MTDSNANPEQRRKARTIVRFAGGAYEETDDFLATEEPLEIRVVFGPAGKRKDRSLSITMRTPGNDHDLAAGFLLGEGIVKKPDDIVQFEETGKPDEETGRTNQLCVHLSHNVAFDFGSLQRNFYTTSSCGICGRASLEAVRSQFLEPINLKFFKVETSVITSLPTTLRKHQATFDETGGLHAAGLFNSMGDLISCREDVGRHNAMDKLIGNRFLEEEIPLKQRIVVVSGRASFELVQKVIAGGVPILVAVGAPSSLAVELAEEFGVTLVGFASRERFNVYSHSSRIDFGGSSQLNHVPGESDE